jgi:hypothetical protein
MSHANKHRDHPRGWSLSTPHQKTSQVVPHIDEGCPRRLAQLLPPRRSASLTADPSTGDYRPLLPDRPSTREHSLATTRRPLFYNLFAAASRRPSPSGARCSCTSCPPHHLAGTATIKWPKVAESGQREPYSGHLEMGTIKWPLRPLDSSRNTTRFPLPTPPHATCV